MFSRKDSTTTVLPQTDDAQRNTTSSPTSTLVTPAGASLTPATTQSAPPPAPASAPAPIASANTGGNTGESLIAVEDTFEGQLRSTRGVRVLGTVRGSIESTQYVHIEENAHVEADITAAEVVIAGEYEGKLSCRQRVEIRATGRVSGQIETEKLLLHEGGYFDGELHMQKPSDAPKPVAKADTADNQSRRPRHVDLPSDGPKAREANSDAPKS